MFIDDKTYTTDIKKAHLVDELLKRIDKMQLYLLI